MAFLPDRHRSPPPRAWSGQERRYPPAHLDATEWRVVRRRPSFVPIALTLVGAAVVGAWLRGDGREAALQSSNVVVIRPPDVHVNTPPTAQRTAAAPQQQSSFWQMLNGDRCAEPDGRVRDWGNPNRAGGGGPIDVFGFLPKCAGGR